MSTCILSVGEWALWDLGSTGFPLRINWFKDNIYMAGFAKREEAIAWAQREGIVRPPIDPQGDL